MARRPRPVTVRMIGRPGLFAAESVARLLIELEKARIVPIPGDSRPQGAPESAGGML